MPSAPPPQPPPGSNAPRKLRITLRPWQACIDSILSVPEDPFGRTILWLYDEVGGFGKSIMAKHLWTWRHPVSVSGRDTDVLYVVSNAIESGRSPKIICVDLYRSSDQVPWDALEQAKNGVVASGKYTSKVHHIGCPHIVVFANVPDPDVGVKVSQDRVIQVELREFASWIESCDKDPTTYDELREFSSVKTWGRSPQSSNSGPANPNVVSDDSDDNDDDDDDSGNWVGMDE